jgi:hypothetical protein
MKIKNLLFAILLFVCIGCYSDGDDNENSINDGGAEAMELKPIKEYDAYFLTENKALYGINDSGIEIIITKDIEGKLLKVNDFFKFNNKLYFEFIFYKENENQKKYFVQSNNITKKIYDLPTKPVSSRSIMISGAFSIQNFNYIDPNTDESILCSDIKNLNMQSGIERFVLVNGYKEYLYNGLYFNVEIGRGDTRKPGLYFWKWNKTTPTMLEEKGLLY